MEYHFTVSYEGTIEAPTADDARTWAEEEVAAGHYRPVIVEAVPISRKEPHGSDD